MIKKEEIESENIEQFPREKWDHYLPSVTAKKKWH